MPPIYNIHYYQDCTVGNADFTSQEFSLLVRKFTKFTRASGKHVYTCTAFYFPFCAQEKNHSQHHDDFVM